MQSVITMSREITLAFTETSSLVFSTIGFLSRRNKGTENLFLDNIFSGHKTWSWKVRKNVRESQHARFERETYGLGINSRSHDLTSKSEARSEKIEIVKNFRWE